MDKLVKSLKTTKRRLSQQFKVVTGKAEVTADAEFDLAYRNFNDLENNLKALSSQCIALIHNVDTWCDTNRRLADELLRFTSKSILDTTEMKAYKQAISNLHTALQYEYDYTRRSILCILRSNIINRLEILLKQDFAEVEKYVKVRKNLLIDYDSHRSKCSMYEKRGDSTKAEKFRLKMDHDYQMIQEHKEYLEIRFKELIEIGTAILSQETATLIACELFLVRRQQEAMEKIALSFQQDCITQVIESIEKVIASIQSGENIEQLYVPTSLDLPSFPYHEPPVVTDYTACFYGSGEVNYANPNTNSNTNSNTNPTSRPQVQPHSRFVRALYSLETDVEGELPFKEGDMIEVLKEDSSGWWDGRLKNQVGKFPSNYTTAVFFVCFLILFISFTCLTNTVSRLIYKSDIFIFHKQRLRSNPVVKIPFSFQSHE